MQGGEQIVYAVIRSGGKQYRVQSGEQLRVEALAAQVGAAVSFDEVLLVGEGDGVKVGAPFVYGAQVKAAATRCASSSCAAASTTRRPRGIGSRIPSCASTTSFKARGKEAPSGV
jgi:ribosomal protein L21